MMRRTMRSSRPSTRSCGAPSAGSSTPKCARTSTSGSAPVTSPTRCSAGAASSASSASTTPPRWGGSDGDLAAGLVFVEELARCGAARDRDGDLGADRTWRRPRSREFGTDDQRERWLGPRSRARRSARSRSPSPTPAPTSPRSAPAPCATATCWRDQRPQDVHHQRRTGPLPHARRQDRPRRRAPRRVAVHRRHVAARRVGVAPAREARHARVRHRRDRARRRRACPHADLDRPRTGSGLRAADVAAAVRAARGRGRVRRSRRADARRHDRVRARTHDVRPADRASTR